MSVHLKQYLGTGMCYQGFSYLSGVGARGLLNLEKYNLSHQNWEI